MRILHLLERILDVVAASVSKAASLLFPLSNTSVMCSQVWASSSVMERNSTLSAGQWGWNRTAYISIICGQIDVMTPAR
ncbi:MAG: hypothetical protein AAB225_10205 [Acidobacteriota bacterium]